MIFKCRELISWLKQSIHKLRDLKVPFQISHMQSREKGKKEPAGGGGVGVVVMIKLLYDIPLLQSCWGMKCSEVLLCTHEQTSCCLDMDKELWQHPTTVPSTHQTPPEEKEKKREGERINHSNCMLLKYLRHYEIITRQNKCCSTKTCNLKPGLWKVSVNTANISCSICKKYDW